MTTLTQAEQALNGAKAQFNISRMQLGHALATLNPREASADKLIYTAEEYGLDHALKLLQHNPAQFDLGQQPDDSSVAAITTSLSVAYDANYALDRAMAAREALLEKTNPAHRKAVLVADQELSPNAAGQARLPDGSAATLEHVHTEDEGDHEDENARDR